MGLSSRLILSVPSLFLTYFCFNICEATDKITSTQFIQDPEVIVSNGSNFKLGFFSPLDSTKRYVGIWHNGTNATTPQWVANRGNPLNDSSGILTISEDGNLVVLNGKREVLWTSNLTKGSYNSSAVLTDDGNIVLRDGTDGNILWESFQQPSDTLLRNMKVGTNPKTGKKLLLTSWKSISDPSIGSFSAGIDPSGIPECFVWKDSLPYWRSGPWVGQVFVGIPDMDSVYLDGYNLAIDQDGSYSLSFSYANDPSLHNLVLDSEGQLRERFWDSGKESWEDDWKSLKSECDLYGKCGEFGFCNPQNTPICSCLHGFEPRNPQEWDRGIWSSGCARRTSLQCERIRNGSEVDKEDGFLRLQAVKVPYYAHWSSSLEQECRDECLNNCSCLAYSYYAGFGCMTWSTNLIDVQKFTARGADLYIRVAYSELGKRRSPKLVISIAVPVGAITIALCTYYTWKWMARHQEMKRKKKNEANLDEDRMSEMNLQELPVFNMQNMVIATGNFNASNKLGEGGFGPVYKGILADGKEIAVKRLSRSSGQGLEEFMNEVKVMSKLQHRNLVRLHGCCVEGEEKMLVYEYMPNKSLDTHLFDPYKRTLLNWDKRLSIVEGICRGLLYLHRDSRLRIIHRDLKPSNILLDQELNPKISDFGMARIFGGNEDQVNTRRVVGTYGYMSPEYALRGQFSEKSDVFSLGIILLEIVSGKKITSYPENEERLSLLSFAWKLWSDGKISAMIDPVISDAHFHEDVLRCIHVGLLCVQDLAKDRPAVSDVMSMLNRQISNLPSPKQPAVAESLIRLDPEYSQKSQDLSSVNLVTVTDFGGR